MPVALLTEVTCAFDTAAPLWSVIVPLTDPKSTCALVLWTDPKSVKLRATTPSRTADLFLSIAPDLLRKMTRSLQRRASKLARNAEGKAQRFSCSEKAPFAFGKDPITFEKARLLSGKAPNRRMGER